MNFENSSMIGVDKVWMRVAPDGIDVASINLEGERWSGTPRSRKVDGAYMPVKDSFRFDGVGEGHLLGTIDTLRRTAEIQFNPTHFFGDYGLTSNVGDAFSRAFDLMASIGLKIDRDACTIKRFDTARDAALTESPSNYAAPLQMYLSAKRESTRLAYTDGLTIGNQSMQIGFYNRALHLTNKKVLHSLHTNTARNEIRCLSKGANVWRPKYYGDTIADVMKLDASALNEIYRDQFKTLVSIADESARIGIPHAMEMTSDVYDEMLYFKSIYGSRWQSHLMTAYGLQALYDKIGEVQLVEMIVDIDSNKTSKLTRHRLKKKHSDLLTLERIRSTFAKRKPISYVDEYLQTFAA
jgi:hypothetical protein